MLATLSADFWPKPRVLQQWQQAVWCKMVKSLSDAGGFLNLPNSDTSPIANYTYIYSDHDERGLLAGAIHSASNTLSVNISLSLDQQVTHSQVPMLVA
jgi:hypothetical protein